MADGQTATAAPVDDWKDVPQDDWKDVPASQKTAPPTGNAGTQQHPLVTPLPGESFADTMRRGAEMGKQVTPEQLETAKSGALRDVPTVLGAASLPSLATGIAKGASAGVPGLLKFGRTMIGAGVGAGIGGSAGSSLGGHFGETGRKIGGIAGSIGGGMLGGGLASGLEREPATMSQALALKPGRIKALPFGIQRGIPEWMVPSPSEEAMAAAQARARQEMLGSFMNRGYRPAADAMPALTGTVEAPESVAGSRSLVLTPSEAKSEDVLQGIAKRRASERGMQFAGGMTPREGRKVPKLPTRMRPTEYPGPREVTRFSDDDDE